MEDLRSFGLITLFPDALAGMLDFSILKRAKEKNLVRYHLWNLRDFGTGRYRSTDDYPYGGGSGMILRPDPIFRATRVACASLAGMDPSPEGSVRLVYPSPQGAVFTQSVAWGWANDPRPVLFLCGHYEGIDERVLMAHPFEEWSIGDYVLTGGEIPALAMIDAVVRLIPGVLSDHQSVLTETFSAADEFDFPQYTRPPDYEGMAVPEVLLSGHHLRIQQYRSEKAREKRDRVRPDLRAISRKKSEMAIAPQEQQERINGNECH